MEHSHRYEPLHPSSRPECPEEGLSAQLLGYLFNLVSSYTRWRHFFYSQTLHVMSQLSNVLLHHPSAAIHADRFADYYSGCSGVCWDASSSASWLKSCCPALDSALDGEDDVYGACDNGNMCMWSPALGPAFVCNAVWSLGQGDGKASVDLLQSHTCPLPYNWSNYKSASPSPPSLPPPSSSSEDPTFGHCHVQRTILRWLRSLQQHLLGMQAYLPAPNQDSSARYTVLQWLSGLQQRALGMQAYLPASNQSSSSSPSPSHSHRVHHTVALSNVSYTDFVAWIGGHDEQGAALLVVTCLLLTAALLIFIWILRRQRILLTQRFADHMAQMHVQQQVHVRDIGARNAEKKAIEEARHQAEVMEALQWHSKLLPNLQLEQGHWNDAAVEAGCALEDDGGDAHDDGIHNQLAPPPSGCSHIIQRHQQLFIKVVQQVASCNRGKLEEYVSKLSLLRGCLVSVHADVFSQKELVDAFCFNTQRMLCDVTAASEAKVAAFSAQAAAERDKHAGRMQELALKGEQQVAALHKDCQAQLKARELRHADELAKLRARVAAFKKVAMRGRATLATHWLVLRQDVKVQMSSLVTRAAWHAHEHNIELTQLEKALAEEKVSCLELKAEMELLQSDLEVALSQLDDFAQALQDNAEHAMGLSGKLSAKDQQIQQSKVLMNQLQEGLQGAEEKLYSFELQCEALEVEVAREKAQTLASAKEIDELKERTSALQQQVDQIPFYASQLVQAKKVIQELVARVQAGEQQVVELQDEVLCKESLLQEVSRAVAEEKAASAAKEAELVAMVERRAKETSKLIADKEQELQNRISDATMLAEENTKLVSELKALRPARSPLPQDAKSVQLLNSSHQSAAASNGHHHHHSHNKGGAAPTVAPRVTH